MIFTGILAWFENAFKSGELVFFDTNSNFIGPGYS